MSANFEQINDHATAIRIMERRIERAHESSRESARRYAV